MKRLHIIFLIVITLICLIGFFVILFHEEGELKELMLSNYPRLFNNDTIIVIGKNANETEKESADIISLVVENSTSNKPTIFLDTQISESDKIRYNMIIVGIPQNNCIFEEVYERTDAIRVTDTYPGEGKVLIEIIGNPWNRDKTILLLGGSDERGVKVGAQLFDMIDKPNTKKVILDWTNININKQALALELTPIEFDVLDEYVRDYFSQYTNTTDYLIVYRRNPEKEQYSDSKVIEATARYIVPSPTAIFGYNNKKVYLIIGVDYAHQKL